MKFNIRHRIRYNFNKPVFPEPHFIRMRPKSGPRQNLNSFRLTVEPAPAGISVNTGIDDTGCSVAWFDGMVDRLIIEAESEVETFKHNPFDFILTDNRFSKLPIEYPADEKNALHPYLLPLTEQGPAERAFVASALNAVDKDTISFPGRLASGLSSAVRHAVRHEEGIIMPEDLLANLEGSCRDVTFLFVNACRRVGLAARFASGYQAGLEHDGTDRELHSWAEVYFPGGGWRGYDPSAGIACVDEHVVIASAPDIDLTAPVTGTVRGEQAGVMSYGIEIDIS